MDCTDLPEDIEPLMLLPYRLTNESIFLAIGTCVGKLALFAAATVGCRSHSSEIDDKHLKDM